MKERAQVSIGHHTHLGAGRPVKHPCWNLKPTVGIRTAQITAKNNGHDTGSSLPLTAAPPLGSLTLVGTPLIEAENLFR